MGEWNLIRLGDICDLFDGPHQTAPLTPDGPIVYLNVGDIRAGRIELRLSGRVSEEIARTWSARVTPRAGDVVFGYEATVGHAAILSADRRWCLGRRVGLLRPRRNRVDPRFLLYAWYSPRFQETLRANRVGGTTIESIRLTDVPSWTMALPCLEEQGRLADILGALDDKIELNRRMNETLEALARAIFTSWFVDFDPVRARAEGRQPVGMDAETAALFPDSFEDSPLGPIPSAWSVSPIGDAVTVVGGSTPRTNEPSFWNGDIPFATPKDLSGVEAPVLLSTSRRVTNEGAEQVSSGILEPGTVLLSSRAPIGYLAIAETPVVINQGFIAMRCAGPLPNVYVLHWARQNMPRILAAANGTTFLEVSKRNFRPIPVLVPNDAVLRAYTATVGPMHERIVSSLRETRVLATTRDALLPKLISGEIRIADRPRVHGDGSMRLDDGLNLSLGQIESIAKTG